MAEIIHRHPFDIIFPHFWISEYPAIWFFHIFEPLILPHFASCICRRPIRMMHVDFSILIVDFEISHSTSSFSSFWDQMIKWPPSGDRFAFTGVFFNCHLIVNVWNWANLSQTMGRSTQSAENNMWSVCGSFDQLETDSWIDSVSATCLRGPVRICHVDQL